MRFLLSFILLLSLSVLTQAQTKLWGLNSSGGTSDHGTLGSYDPITSKWAVSYDFKELNPGGGAQPFYTELIELNGVFYGLTAYGGVNDAGVIFAWDPIANIYTKKIDFDFVGDKGASPQGSLTYAEGKFYGLTYKGGANDKGVIFEWDPVANIYTKKLDFDGDNGAFPKTSMTYLGGKLYGMTTQGGINKIGVIFELDLATNTYTKKIDFTASGGANPFGTLALYEGKFYATAYGGFIFEWNPMTNIYTKKVNISTKTSLTIKDGKFYGISPVGGANGKGSIFEYDPSTNILIRKFDFTTSVDGRDHQGKMTLSGGKFYGTSYSGGPEDIGTLYEWDPLSNIYTKKIDLTQMGGQNPYGPLAISNGKFYGLTSRGGVDKLGAIFEWDPSTNVYSKKVDFISSRASGWYPQGSLSFYANKFYGFVHRGANLNKGLDGLGAIFEFDPISGVYTKKIEFGTGVAGTSPSEYLTLYNKKFYGLLGSGQIYEWDPATNIYTKKVDFVSAAVVGGLVYNNGKFYAMTNAGGAFNQGSIIEWEIATNNITTKINFNGANGSTPYGSLTYANGKFYGMTSRGGVNNVGVIFEWDPSTNIYTKKFDLNTSISGGYYPFGSLLYYNSKFYGLAGYGGIYSVGLKLGGVLFEWDPTTNMYTKKVDFANATGDFPLGDLTQSNGKLYGMTREGGANDLGVLFEWDPSTNVYIKKIDLSNVTGGVPIFPRLLEVPVLDQIITFDALPSKTYGDIPFSLTATSTSDQMITYTSSDQSVATINGNVVTILKAGTTTIATTQPGNLFYNAASPVQQQLNIDKANQVIVFPVIQNKSILDQPFVLLATANSGLPITYSSNNASVATINGSTVTIVGVGNVTITASQVGSINYNTAQPIEQTFIVNKQDQTINFPSIASSTLGNIAFALNASASSSLPVSFSTISTKISLSGNLVSMLSAGQVTVKASQSGNSIYASALEVSQTFCINPPKPSITTSNLSIASLTSSATDGNQWFKDGVAIASATNSTLNVIAAGVYSVQVSVETCKSLKSDDLPIIITGDIFSNSTDAFFVYPNPVKQNLTINLKVFGKQRPVEIFIYNSLGMIVEKVSILGGKDLELSVSQYPSGTYIIKSAQGDSSNSVKFIKD